ncbi:hypothetical protein MMC27_008868 [Xylographa pallens]|nr:hypothetical protein [Xylographa pallens]
MLSQLGVGASKASVLLLYLRIFIQKRFRICVQVMLGLVAAWTITFFLTDLFSCIPVTPLVEPFYGNQCMDTVSMWYAGSVSDIILDLLILMIPIPMVLRLQLPAKQKMGVLAMFFLGAVACAASIARLVIFLQVGAVLATKFNDETYYTSPVFFWTVIELALAIISACLPTLRPIYTHFNPPPVRTYSKDTSYKLGSSRFGGHPYSHTNGTESADDDYRLVLTEQEPSVQTHIETNHAETPPQLVNGRIVVSRDISSVDQVIQHV